MNLDRLAIICLCVAVLCLSYTVYQQQMTLMQWHAKGKLKVGDEYVHESFIGSKFVGRIIKESSLNGKSAIIPSIQGWAKVYGYNNIIIDAEDDPYAHGFQVI